MRFYSTRDRSHFVTAEEAIVANLCPKGGLYMPEFIPVNLSLKQQSELSLAQIGLEVAKTFLSESFGYSELELACKNAFNFEAPLHQLCDDLFVLELTHGPSMAFKDFGARFMAECLSLIAQKRATQYNVLTATSGDTGAAVAAALHAKPGVKVTILYPFKRISPFQEGQMTKWGGNIKTIAVKGSFDDCQRLVKQAFSNQELSQRLNLVSANSINISRLLAQMVYYIKAIRELKFRDDLCFIVPSGNLGNLTAGVFAARYMDSNCKFVAAHNNNSSFPEYIRTGLYQAKESVTSFSNAMDVGAPSNFERLESFFNSDVSSLRNLISAALVNNQETLEQMRSCQQKFGYIVCPHTAVGLKAAMGVKGCKVVLSTAHPKKFSEVLSKAAIPFSYEDLDRDIMEPTYTIESELSELLKTI